MSRLAAGLLFAVVVAAGALPVLVLIVEALLTAREGAWATAWQTYRGALWGTLRVSFGAAMMALLLGLTLAIVVERTDVPGARWLRACFTLPIALPPYLLGMGWVFLASPRAGYLNRLFGEGTFDIYGYTGMSWVLGVSALPLVFLPVCAALRDSDASLEEAARISGASAVRTIWDVTVPLALPTAISGAALAFLLAASAFGVPYLLGVVTSPPSVVLTTRIYALTLIGSSDARVLALTLSAVLLVIGTLTLLAGRWVATWQPVRRSSGKGRSKQKLQLGGSRTAVFSAAAAAAILLVLLPIGIVVLSAFQRSAGGPVGLDALTLDHWRQVFNSDRALFALVRSATFAAAAGVIVVAVGTAVAIVSRRGALGRVTAVAASWPYAVPGTVLAMALILAYGSDLRFVFADRVAVVLMIASLGLLAPFAYSVKHLAIGVRAASDAMERIDPSLSEAARISGASAGRAWADVTLPLIRPALGAAFILTFLLCATELTLSVLLVAPGQDLVGTLIFEWQSYANPSAASVLATLVILLASVGLWWSGYGHER